MRRERLRNPLRDWRRSARSRSFLGRVLAAGMRFAARSRMRALVCVAVLLCASPAAAQESDASPCGFRPTAGLPPVGRATVPPPPTGVELAFVPQHDDAVLYEMVDADYWLAQGCNIPPEVYEPICRGGCTVRLASGPVHLAVRGESFRGTWQRFELERPATLRAQDVDRSEERSIGVGLLIGGALTGVGAAISAGFLPEQDSVATVLGGAGILGTIAIGVGLYLVGLRDYLTLELD